MSYEDRLMYEQEEAMERFLKEELRRIAEEPVFHYLAVNGDEIEERVNRCIAQAEVLSNSGNFGAALTRAATGIEITIRFFLTQPLVQSAFLSDEWAKLLSAKVLKIRTAEDRELLPAMLRHWKMDITKVKLSDGSQAWEQIVHRVLPRRNDYVHEAEDATLGDALLAIECLQALLAQVIDPLAITLGFTREQTGCWSTVIEKHFPDLNPPRTYPRQNPFAGKRK
ncbi:MAG: hypothetical protein AB9866_07970 [Syntrophobacteraceae bacterium]